MEETIISRKNLAERWGKTTETIIQYEQQGVIKRLKLPSPHYSLKQIIELEETGIERKSLEHRQLEKKYKKLLQENEEYKERIAKIINFAMKGEE